MSGFLAFMVVLIILYGNDVNSHSSFIYFKIFSCVHTYPFITLMKYKQIFFTNLSRNFINS